jgi:chorismate lyase/3-hydroxybenzoate synthase
VSLRVQDDIPRFAFRVPRFAFNNVCPDFQKAADSAIVRTVSASPKEIAPPIGAVCRHFDANELPSPEETLAVVAFDQVVKAPDVFTVSVPLSLIEPLSLVEVWTSNSAVKRASDGVLQYACNDHVLFGAVTVDAGDDLTEATRQTYLHMTRTARALGYAHYLRIWNHMPSINENACGLERYRQFSVGRYQAFAELGYALRSDLPPASAVGSHHGALSIHFIAARSAATQLENPRQVSAFDYPEKYGPRSPSFSRAGVKQWSDRSQLFLSGTASIIGHESQHHDAATQTEETMRNIGELLRAGGDFSFDDLQTLKVYVRNRADLEEIRQRVDAWRSEETDVVYVEADICRRELLVEIEGIAERIA